MARSIWAVVERERKDGEQWLIACERQILEAMRAEGLTQIKIAELLSVQLGTLNHKLERLSMRPRGKRHTPVAPAMHLVG